MGTFLKFVIIGILVLLAINVAWFLFKVALSLVVPALVLAAIGYIVYHLMKGSLSGGSDKSLPK